MFFVSCLAFNTSYYQLAFQNEKSFSAEKAGGLNLEASGFDFLIILALFFCNGGRIHQNRSFSAPISASDKTVFFN